MGGATQQAWLNHAETEDKQRVLTVALKSANEPGSQFRADGKSPQHRLAAQRCCNCRGRVLRAGRGIE